MSKYRKRSKTLDHLWWMHLNWSVFHKDSTFLLYLTDARWVHKFFLIYCTSFNQRLIFRTWEVVGHEWLEGFALSGCHPKKRKERGCIFITNSLCRIISSAKHDSLRKDQLRILLLVLTPLQSQWVLVFKSATTRHGWFENSCKWFDGLLPCSLKFCSL